MSDNYIDFFKNSHEDWGTSYIPLTSLIIISPPSQMSSVISQSSLFQKSLTNFSRLRLFSLIPLALSILTARRLLNLPRHIHTTSSTLTLTTELLIANPFLLALSPAILLTTLLLSIPFLTVIFRLLLIGYPVKESSAWEWHLYARANWGIIGTVAIWLWSWGVARGILRMTCASVIGAWYFAEYVCFFPCFHVLVFTSLASVQTRCPLLLLRRIPSTPPSCGPQAHLSEPLHYPLSSSRLSVSLPY